MSKQRTRRYPGLNYFTSEQKEQFFGRDEEKAALLALVLTEKIVALFGKSGYGKSSLLRAGLIPKLPHEWIPIIVQLGAFQAGQSLSPLERTLSQLDAALPAHTSETDFLESISDPNTLWHRFRRKQGIEKRQFLLLFDQFEEFQTYPQEQRDQFKQQLSELLFTRIPQRVRDASDELPDEQQVLLALPTEVKTLFAVREDRLSVLDSLVDKLPAILQKRYHLRGLDDLQATEAIVKPASLPQAERYESPRFSYDPVAIQAIKQGLKKNEQDTTIESFLLQICCEEIERGVIERSQHGAAGEIVVTERDLPVFKVLFEQYYRNKIFALPDVALQSAARRMIEDQLVKTDPVSGIAYRINADGRVLCALPGVDESLLKRLTNVFLLRSEPNTTGGFSYEVSHDRLMEGILAMKKEFEAEKAEKRRQQERTEAERRARAAEEKASEENLRAEEAEHLKNDAVQGRKRARIFAVAAGLVAAFAILIGFIAFSQWQTAQSATQSAEEARVAANQKLVEALQEKQQRVDVELENAQRALEVYEKAVHLPLIEQSKIHIDSLRIEKKRIKKVIEQAHE